MSFKIAWGSCSSNARNNSALQVAIDGGITTFFSLGDTPYVNATTTAWGVSTTAVTKTSTVADFTAFYTQQYASPGYVALLASGVDHFTMADDHEWGGDNWDHTITQANSQTSIGAVTQAEVDAHFWVGVQAIQAANTLYADNPTNTDAEAVAEKPPNAAAGTPVSQYPVRYFRIGYDVNGNRNDASPFVEFFVLDCISYRSPLVATDDASKTMLGANQKAWLKARVVSSAATFKVIVSPKKTNKNTGADNGDTFGTYNTELQEIGTYFDTNSVTGLIWLSGDRHTPQVQLWSKAGGDAFDLLDVTACPLGVDVNSNATDTTISDHTINYWTPTNGVNQVYGLLHITDTYMEVSMRDGNTGGIIWQGRVLAGENTLTRLTGLAI